MKRTITALLLASLAFMTLSAPVFAAGGPIRVVSTIYPLTDIVRQVGGNRVMVTTLLTSGMSEHVFEPTTAQIRQMADVSLYVRVGAQMDTWGDKLLAAAKRPPLIVTATAGVPLLSIAEKELVKEEEAEAHHHGGDDPHVWLDPIIVRDHLVPSVVNALCRISPADAAYFKSNGKRFAADLTSLDLAVRNSLKPLKQRDFIALHGAWHYLAKRYGLRQIAAVEPFPGKEPSAKYIAGLVSMARKNGVTTIFAEPQLSAKAAEVIANELKGRVLLLDPLGGETVPGRDSYIALIRYDVSVISRGMK